ncbi:hypothetical protein DFH09DRAFT_1104448 [Mycena vulgaris]|nr:hypothetical protein DFH09DRAFT_1104448 [Mycena vulgaris]
MQGSNSKRDDPGDLGKRARIEQITSRACSRTHKIKWFGLEQIVGDGMKAVEQYKLFSALCCGCGDFTFRLAKRACARANGLVQTGGESPPLQPVVGVVAGKLRYRWFSGITLASLLAVETAIGVPRNVTELPRTTTYGIQRSNGVLSREDLIELEPTLRVLIFQTLQQHFCPIFTPDAPLTRARVEVHSIAASSPRIDPRDLKAGVQVQCIPCAQYPIPLPTTRRVLRRRCNSTRKRCTTLVLPVCSRGAAGSMRPAMCARRIAEHVANAGVEVRNPWGPQKKRKRPLPKLEKNTIPAPGNVPTTRLVTIEGNKTVSIKEKIVATAAPQNLVAPTVTESPPPENESLEPEEETITQTGKLMAEYGDKLPDIIRLWVARKSSARVGSPCYCGNGVRTTQCRDCRQYDLSCESCWIRNHENNPFHWAHVWKAELGFFVKHDISAVDGGNHAVSLGHYGKPCPNAGTSQMTTLVEPNGIHATKIYFCGCHDNPSIGGHARQMNNGHRQDTLIANANDWNWKKTVKMHVSLYDDLSSAKKLFLQKRKPFIGLSLSNLDEIEGWHAMARQTQKYNGGVKSVYRHTTSKAFLKAGLKIQADQRKIMDARSKNDEHDLQATKKEISTRRTKLTALLGKWRDVRDNIMVEAADSIACAQSCEIELEKLWLPSDFTEVERVAMGPNIIALAAEEAKLREGEAYDLIRVIQTICRGLSALEDRKKDVRGQKDNTISGEQVLDTRHRRDCAIKAYNPVRKALLHLGMIQDGGDKKDSQFPHLTVDDTFMKSRRRERALGDSRRGDGMLYTRIGVSAGSKVSNAPEVVEEGDEDDSGGEPDSKRRCQGNEGGPQMNKRSKRKPAAEKRKEKELEALTALDPNPANKNGWLWELRRPSNMTDIEMQQWEREGDRVQWARAEAEMDRFQEQLEIKIAEFLRCIASFDFNAQVWTKMSANEQPGFQEQAKETAYMWMTLGDQCRKHLKMAGYQFALEPGFDFPALIAYLEKERDRNDALIREAGIGQFTI